MDEAVGRRERSRVISYNCSSSGTIRQKGLNWWNTSSVNSSVTPGAADTSAVVVVVAVAVALAVVIGVLCCGYTGDGSDVAVGAVDVTGGGGACEGKEDEEEKMEVKVVVGALDGNLVDASPVVIEVKLLLLVVVLDDGADDSL